MLIFQFYCGIYLSMALHRIYNYDLLLDIRYNKYVYHNAFWKYCACIVLYCAIYCVCSVLFCILCILCNCIISQMWINVRKEQMIAAIYVIILMVVLYVNVKIHELDCLTILKTVYVSVSPNVTTIITS